MTRTIGLDYGHADGLERRRCTEMAHFLAFALQRNPGTSVLLSQLTDLAWSREEKARWAEEAGADIWISFHLHPVARSGAHGFSTYVDCCAGLETRSLQARLHNGAVFELRKHGVPDLGKKNDTEAEPGAFPLLAWARAPAVCLEWRYLPGQEELAGNPGLLRSVARAVAEGIRPSVPQK